MAKLDHLRVGLSSSSVLKQIQKYTVQFTAPALSSAAESTYTVTGVSTGTVLVFTVTNPINANRGTLLQFSF